MCIIVTQSPATTLYIVMRFNEHNYGIKTMFDLGTIAVLEI